MMRNKRFRVAVVVVVAAFVVSICLLRPMLERKVQASLEANPQTIYSLDPNDSWNSIFYHLFTRKVKASLTRELSSNGPFSKVDVMGFPQGLSVSTRLSERIEIGDRAIEPFYPSFSSSSGIHEVLDESRFSQLKQSLIVALNEKKARPPLHRALMQADVWAAHDLLARVHRYRGSRVSELQERASQLVPLLARMVKKLALTPNEIKNLPDNYALAAEEHGLPDLFSPDSEWMEVQWVQSRLHDHAADHRRAARVFLKPGVKLRDRQRFLDELPHNHGDTPELGAVALVMQNLVIDNEGNVAPTRVTYEIQIRTFERDGQGRIVRTKSNQYELSRKLLLDKLETGRMVTLGEDAPMYLPSAGNDYDFASPQRDQRGEMSPILATLRTRCGTCHGQPNAPVVFTFNMHAREPIPAVKLLEQPNDIRARYVAGRKVDREDFKTLTESWKR